MKVFYIGKGLGEIGYIKRNGKNEVIIRIDKNYFRPNLKYIIKKENANKAFKDLKFKPKFLFNHLVKDMLDSDIRG